MDPITGTSNPKYGPYYWHFKPKVWILLLSLQTLNMDPITGTSNPKYGSYYCDFKPKVWTVDSLLVKCRLFVSILYNSSIVFLVSILV